MHKLPFEERTNEIMILQDAETSDKFGKNPYDRSIEELLKYGIVNIDKPAGPTSHQVSAYVKRALHIDKTGHSGTLDPAVTGVLPVGLGKGTRTTHSLLKAGKEYVCIMKVHDDLEAEEVIEALKSFEGVIEQLPPVRSAVKREERERRIYYIDIIEIKDRDVMFKVGCEAGTYIRKLCHDVGEKLGTGAHMHQLRRTKAGPFKEDSLVTLNDLSDSFYLWKSEGDESLKKLIQPLEEGVSHLPKIWVLDTTVNSLCHGASLKVPGVARVSKDLMKGEQCAVMTLKGELVMVAKSAMSSEKMKEKDRGVAAKPDQVFMDPDTYPKIQK